MNAHNTQNKVGFEFTIRTPSTPQRFKQFGKQFEKLWKELREVAGEDLGDDNDEDDEDDEDEEDEEDEEEEEENLRLRKWATFALKYFFYWVR